MKDLSSKSYAVNFTKCGKFKRIHKINSEYVYSCRISKISTEV